MDDLLNEFLIETSNRLAELDSDITRFVDVPDDGEICARLLDLLHTIKGTSGFLALPRLEAIAQSAENLLSRVDDGRVAATPDVSAAIVSAIGVVRRILLSLATSGHEPSGDDHAVLNLLSIAGGAPVRPDLDEPSVERLVVDDKNVNAVTPPSAAPVAVVPGPRATSVQVPIDRLESFADLVGQLVLARNNLNRIARSRDDSELEETAQRFNDITSDLGKGITATRRQALGAAGAEMPGSFDIVTAIMVACGSQHYAIPQRNIMELIWVTPSPGMGSSQDEFRFLRLREQRYPWVRLSTLLHINIDRELSRRREIVFMMQVGDDAFGLSVERVFDAEEIVVRPQPPILRKSAMFTGNAILGNGAVAMVLDPAEIAAELGHRRQMASVAHAPALGD